MDWSMYTEEERRDLRLIYERLRKHGLHWGPDGFNMATLDRMFSSPKWRYDLKETDDGYQAMVQLHFDPGVIDRGMGEGRLPEIAILRGLDLAISNGFVKGEKKK